MIQIIHMSDFHLSSTSMECHQHQLVDSLIEDIKNQHVDLENSIFVISGDLIDKGGSSFFSIENSFDEFQIFFVDKIIEKIGISPNRIFFVPGNHDLDRKK